MCKVAQGDLPGALASYEASKQIREQLAERDPGNAGWQRDLIVSNVKLNQVTGEKSYLQQALAIAEDMQAKGILAPADAWLIDAIKSELID